MGQIELCNSWSIDCFVARQEFGGFGAPLVDDREDTIVFLTFGEVHNEVHGYVLKGSFFNMRIKSLKWGFLSGDIGLQFLTIGTSSYILFDEGMQSWTFVVLGYKIPSIGNSWVSCCQ